MLTPAEISEILNREVRSAQARLAEARANIDSIIAEVPGMLPHPDGQYRLTIAVKEHVKAREALEQALERNTAFMFNGIIPEDLKQKPMGRARDSQQSQSSKLPRAAG
ncbi:MAG: hypothetical protein ABSG41_05170 [Bryobacteraceae bacterium]|jgi:hypothetical protein